VAIALVSKGGAVKFSPTSSSSLASLSSELSVLVTQQVDMGGYFLMNMLMTVLKTLGVSPEQIF